MISYPLQVNETITRVLRAGCSGEPVADLQLVDGAPLADIAVLLS